MKKALKITYIHNFLSEKKIFLLLWILLSPLLLLNLFLLGIPLLLFSLQIFLFTFLLKTFTCSLAQKKFALPALLKTSTSALLLLFALPITLPPHFLFFILVIVLCAETFFYDSLWLPSPILAWFIAFIFLQISNSSSPDMILSASPLFILQNSYPLPVLQESFFDLSILIKPFSGVFEKNELPFSFNPHINLLFTFSKTPYLAQNFPFWILLSGFFFTLTLKRILFPLSFILFFVLLFPLFVLLEPLLASQKNYYDYTLHLLSGNMLIILFFLLPLSRMLPLKQKNLLLYSFTLAFITLILKFLIPVSLFKPFLHDSLGIAILLIAFFIPWFSQNHYQKIPQKPTLTVKRKNLFFSLEKKGAV